MRRMSLTGVVCLFTGAALIYIGVRALLGTREDPEPVLTADEAAWLEWNGIECPWPYDDEQEDAQP